MLKIIFLTATLTVANSLPISNKSNWTGPPGCATILISGGATDEFEINVAHGIHSLTLRDLRKFEKNVKAENRIPTVNQDLSSRHPILWHAPDIKGPDSDKFLTDGLKIVDLVLSNMDNKNWGIRNADPLEALVHIFHMHEIWAKAKEKYEKIKLKPPNQEFCKCATDVDNNGIVKLLRYYALTFREPELIYGVKDMDPKKPPIGASFMPMGMADGSRENPFKPTTIFKQPSESMIHLTDGKSWANMKARNEFKRAMIHSDVALYLYCALR